MTSSNAYFLKWNHGIHLKSRNSCVVQDAIFIQTDPSSETAVRRCSSKLVLKVCNFIKKTLQHRYIPVNFPKFLRTAFLIEHLRWPLIPLHHLQGEYEIDHHCFRKAVSWMYSNDTFYECYWTNFKLSFIHLIQYFTYINHFRL